MIAVFPKRRCDQRILSKKESSGLVFSPNYPLPYLTNVVCRYFIYGMQDEQNLERVRLSFDKFKIPGNHNRDGFCQDGYLKVWPISIHHIIVLYFTFF